MLQVSFIIDRLLVWGALNRDLNIALLATFLSMTPADKDRAVVKKVARHSDDQELEWRSILAQAAIDNPSLTCDPGDGVEKLSSELCVGCG